MEKKLELLSKEICDKFNSCINRKHLLAGEEKEYCLSLKFKECPYKNEDFIPRRKFYV